MKNQKSTALSSQTFHKLWKPVEERNLRVDELLAVLYLWRVIVAIGVALVCGVLPVNGWPPALGFFVASFLSTLFFYRGFLQVDEEEYGGHAQLLADGMPVSMGLFTVTWIITYTAMHS